MSKKHYRDGQDRNGVAARRKLEYEVVMDQIKRRPDAFIARLSKHIETVGKCKLYRATTDHKGYARMNFRYKGQHISIHVQRVFLIMKLRRPIRRGYEAGHEPQCEHRICVAHLREEHYKTNANTAGNKLP